MSEDFRFLGKSITRDLNATISNDKQMQNDFKLSAKSGWEIQHAGLMQTNLIFFEHDRFFLLKNFQGHFKQ